MRSAWRWLAVAALIALAYGYGFVVYRRPATDLQLLSTTKSNPGGPAICPWRSPKADMQAFFPGSTDFTLQTLVLSRHRPEILKRLGPKYHMDTTALYAYNVKQGPSPGALYWCGGLPVNLEPLRWWWAWDWTAG
jgi:hypothetical protein